MTCLKRKRMERAMEMHLAGMREDGIRFRRPLRQPSIFASQAPKKMFTRSRKAR